MNPSFTHILSQSTEAALLLQCRRVVFANTAAMELLGEDCVGQSMTALFGQELAHMQASTFIGDVPVKGKHCLLRVSHLESCQLVFLSPSKTEPVQMSDALIFSVNDTLNSIASSTEKGRLQAERLGDREILDSYATLTRNSFRLQRMITNAGIVRCLSDHNQHLDRQMVDLSQLFGDLLETISQLFGHERFHLDLGSDIQAPVDYHLMRQLLFNLLSNCLIHGDNCSHIRISLSQNKDHAFLCISDNGQGIEAEHMHQVFDRYRHGFSPQQISRGAGLGLTVVRGIAELHGGSLLLESRYGHGTTVRVALRRRLPGLEALRSPLLPENCSMQTILTGLADCLPLYCFTEKFAD